MSQRSTLLTSGKIAQLRSEAHDYGMRYTVQSPDERICTYHRRLRGAVKRINWLMARGHSDIDFQYSPADGFYRHLQINEVATEPALKLRMIEESERNGFRDTQRRFV